VFVRRLPCEDDSLERDLLALVRHLRLELWDETSHIVLALGMLENFLIVREVPECRNKMLRLYRPSKLFRCLPDMP